MAFNGILNRIQSSPLFKKYFQNIFVLKVKSFLRNENFLEKAILIIDNYNQNEFKTGDTELTFLPPNMTFPNVGLLQPID